MKGIYANRPVWFQLVLFFLLFLCGYTISQTVGFVIMMMAQLASGSDFTLTNLMDQPVWVLQSVQLLSAIISFLLPALSAAWLFSPKPKEFLNMRGIPGIRMIFPVTLTTLLIAPAISLIGYYNGQMKLPEFMAPIEELMRHLEDMAGAAIEKMFSEKGFIYLIINLIIVAVTAGVTEEFFFRGTLMSVLQRKIRSHHVVIWTVAFFFSAIHLQFYGFIPRMLLGVYLGYLLYWTKNIWVPVFVHFLNNAIAVVGMSFSSLKENVLFSDEFTPEELRWYPIVAVTGLIFAASGFLVIRKTGQRQAIPEEDKTD
jgi:membrane protease YdiL (CAAX protease family)